MGRLILASAFTLKFRYLHRNVLLNSSKFWRPLPISFLDLGSLSCSRLELEIFVLNLRIYSFSNFEFGAVRARNFK
jgi:hypothetical protein